MDLKLKGKRALVTGSTAGIGLAIAERLAAEGASVVLVGRDAKKLEAAKAQVAKVAAPGAEVSGVVADVANDKGADTLVKAVPETDILINNLGIYEAKAFSDITDDDWRRLFEVNVLSGARLSRHYVKGMLSRDWGRIIFISSESGVVIPSDMIHYGMTKAAQLAISRGLAFTTRGTKVTVNSVLPGPTRSEGIVDFMKSISEHPEASPAEIEAEFFRKHRPASLLQRVIESDEVANLVAYVASPLSAATNGAALRVEGGLVPSI